ncbi:MAG: hypothetical protein ACLF0G_02860 [Candidatus Brocadiia bacterium]
MHPPAPRFLAWLAALGLAVPALADIIELRNGQELRGRVVRTRGDEAEIELDLGGTVVVERGQIAKITSQEAARVSPEALEVSPELMARLEARERVHRLVEALGGSKQADALEARRELAAAGRAALPILRRALAEGGPAQRRHLLAVLAEIGDPASVPAILGILRDPQQAELHVAAVEALDAICGHRLVPTFAGLLAEGKDDAVRAACLEALAARREPFAAPLVVQALREPGLRQQAARAIPRWFDPVMLPYVLPHLDRGSAAARERAALWVAQLIHPNHALALSKLLETYMDAKPVAKALFEGVKRLHNRFPVVGDIELLAAIQAPIREHALEALQKAHPDVRGTEPRNWRAQRAEATQAHVLLLPVGSASRSLVREIAAEAERSLTAEDSAVPFRVGRKPLSLPPGDGEPRDARPLLAQLDRRQLEDCQAVRLVGVTTAQVAMPGYQKALAPTRPGGAIVLSLAGLGGERDQVVRRARRLLLHALARSLGLPPSSDPACPSSPLYEVRDLDAKSPRYAPATQGAFDARWAVERGAAAFRYEVAGRLLGRMAERAKDPRLHARAAYMHERALSPAAAIAQWRAYLALGQDAQVAARVHKRIERLDAAEKWLVAKKLLGQP